MLLNDKKIKALLPSDKCTPNKPDKVSDGNGLQLWVRTTGSKTWVLDYRLNGKRQNLVIGKYPAMSLQQARLKNNEVRELIKQGIDPKAQKYTTVDSGINQFANLAQQWHDKRKTTIKAGTFSRDYSLYERDIKPFIGDKDITTITPLEILDIAHRIENRGAGDMARRAIGQIGQVFTYAMRLGIVTYNPTYKLSQALTPRQQKNFARITINQLPQLLSDIDSYKGDPLTKLGFYLLAYTFVRTNELRFMQWNEVDWQAKLWRIPAERMKMNRPHIVPLAPQVLDILKQIKDFGLSDTYVFFNSSRQQPYSENVFTNALKKMGYRDVMTGHGFRGLASTTLHERQYMHEAIELQLAHDSESKTSKAYNGAKHLPYRVKMMNEWANYLDDVKAGKMDNVIHFGSNNIKKAMND
ncbi:integrase arm-type DNA-binding domain-containing protein [Moraxella osloensis]|nr:integrase arm-type DNA-binding domain-containing protein [Moraxella osloensis]MBL7668141.1 integrase arm-type DNA-binding domain-containing protein [Moraxella osloensis]